MPSGSGMHAPERPVPAPRAVTGTPSSAATATSADTWAASVGVTTTGGLDGGGVQGLVDEQIG